MHRLLGLSCFNEEKISAMCYSILSELGHGNLETLALAADFGNCADITYGAFELRVVAGPA